MRKLSQDQISKYVIARNEQTGVSAITQEMLEKIDLDLVPTILTDSGYVRTYSGFERTVTFSNGSRYKFDSFTPRKATAWHPYFAGDQILIGMEDNGDLIFSNGRWFMA